MTEVVISGTGLFTPEEMISNAELVNAFNQYVSQYNHKYASEINEGVLEKLAESSEAFIEKASGIQSRYVLNKSGILDPEIMQPILEARSDDALSYQAQIGVEAAKQALFQASRDPKEIDLVILACSNMQRAYPAIAIEIQAALGCSGYAYDMNVACSSATFGLKAAADAIAQGSVKKVLVINAEICTGHLDFTDRDCHFIFGDVATAAVLEPAESATNKHGFAMVSARLKTSYSNNIRNNFGFLNRTHPHLNSNAGHQVNRDLLFRQNGRKVFKEVVSMVSEMILEHLSSEGIDITLVKRLWLHQANLNMNQLICRKVLGRDALEEEAPVVLQDYANTSSAGCMIAFHKHQSDLESGDLSIICSFGAGYSAGNLILRKN